MPYPQASQFDHLSFTLADEEALLRLRDRLKEHDCEVTDVIDHGTLRSIYFTDPNGIALEASWWVVDPTGRPVDYADERLFSDPDPVDAVRSCATRARWPGRLAPSSSARSPGTCTSRLPAADAADQFLSKFFGTGLGRHTQKTSPARN